MRLYNTLTRSVEPFAPAHPDGVARFYTCGLTVYHEAHLGNLRTFISTDALRRALEVLGNPVRFVMNGTDVGHMTTDADEGEDKMALAAKREHRDPWQIATHYTELFLQDLDRLNIRRPDILCKATDHIPEMLALIGGSWKGLATPAERDLFRHGAFPPTEARALKLTPRRRGPGSRSTRTRRGPTISPSEAGSPACDAGTRPGGRATRAGTSSARPCP